MQAISNTFLLFSIKRMSKEAQNTPPQIQKKLLIFVKFRESTAWFTYIVDEIYDLTSLTSLHTIHQFAYSHQGGIHEGCPAKIRILRGPSPDCPGSTIEFLQKLLYAPFTKLSELHTYLLFWRSLLIMNWAPCFISLTG